MFIMYFGVVDVVTACSTSASIARPTNNFCMFQPDRFTSVFAFPCFVTLLQLAVVTSIAFAVQGLQSSRAHSEFLPAPGIIAFVVRFGLLVWSVQYAPGFVTEFAAFSAGRHEHWVLILSERSTRLL